MSFVKREYVDQQTVITAENMNAIQDELLRLGVSEGSLWNSVTSAGTKASNALDNEAAAYNYHLQYHVGDYCLYQQKLYRCTVETPAAGETWNSSHWTAVTVGDEMIETASELSELRNTLNHKADVIYDTASGDIASFPDGADGLPVKDLAVAIEPVQSGSGDPSPENVRPISGWAGANVTRTGANLFSYNAIETTNYGITLSAQKNGEVSISGNNTAGSTFARRFNNVLFHFKAGYTYYLKGYWSGNFEPSLNGLKLKFATGWYGSRDLFYEMNSYTPSEDVEGYLFIRVNNGYSVPAGLTFVPYVSITPPPSERSYYLGTTFPISWQSSAGTVYGGTLDVTTGVLTVTHKYYENAGTGDWGEVTSGDARYYIGGVSGDSKDNSPNGWCNIGKLVSSFASDGVVVGSNGRINLCGSLHDAFASTDALKTYLASNPLQVCYELATPQTYQLTPTEVTTLLGQNNIWADCGPSTVEYPCDTKLYIQKINTPTDDDMIADANIASGQYFIVNNNLYLSTTAILAGDPIKPGTNCTLTNLAAALNALNS